MTDQWDPAVLARVAAHHQVIMFDNRGVGLSGGDVANLRVAQMADDAANLLAALHIRKPDVWGQSLGGYIAEELAIRHPTAVRRLVLTSSSAGSGHWVAPAVQLPPVGDNAAILRVIFTPDAAGRAAERAFVSRLALWRPQESLSRTVGDAQTVAVARFLANPGEGAWEALPRVHARTFVGAGLRDVVAPPGNGRLLAARLIHATLHLYPAGHAFYVQDSGRFVPDLLHFLAVH